jgi:pimeloyl-ACP methyl ester carboxylesterase
MTSSGSSPSAAGSAPGAEVREPSVSEEIRDDYGVSDGEWLKIDWREKLQTIEVDSSLGRTPISYVTMGEGPPLLLVHGLGGSWRNWLENIPYLSKTHTVYALDLPGFGRSPNPPEPITIAGFGEAVIDFADKLGMGPETALIGHSMGGFISSEAVISQPDRFSSLTLVSAAGITFADLHRVDRTAREVLMRVGIPIFNRRVEANLGRKRLRAASFAGIISHPSRISREILWEIGYYGASAPALIESAKALVSYDTRERLPEIEMPTLIVWGKRDLLVPVGAAYSYHKRISGSELHIIDDTGHMVQLERPARFNRTVKAFVTAKND